jgi:hypothetical protein
MITVRDPVLQPIPITDLRPTQMTVGMREVREKREHLRKHVAKKIGKYLGAHMIPVVLGPKARHYIIDHHHLALALHKEGLEHVLVSVVANLSALEMDAFWIVLDHHAWAHPYDAKGRRRAFADIPKIDHRARRRPVPQSRRRAAPRRRLRQRHHAVQRIPLG